MLPPDAGRTDKTMPLAMCVHVRRNRHSSCLPASQRYIPRITRHALPVRACLKYAVPWRACLRHAGLRQGAQPTHSTCADRHGTVNTRRHSAGPPTVLTGRLVHCALYTARATSCTNQQPSHHAPDETKEKVRKSTYKICHSVLDHSKRPMHQSITTALSKYQKNAAQELL